MFRFIANSKPIIAQSMYVCMYNGSVGIKRKETHTRHESGSVEEVKKLKGVKV